MVNWNDQDSRRPDPQAVSRGRLGGLTTSMKHNMNDVAANARRGLQARFENEVDPERALTDEERARRVEAARKLYYQRLAMSGAAARRGKGGGKK